MTSDSDWPRIGYLDGKPIDLSTLKQTVHPARWAEVVVDVPGVGRVRPWRFASQGWEVSRGADGVLKV